MPSPMYAEFESIEPYFDMVRKALGDLVDGRHFFDVVADDVTYEVLYDFPGWPRIISGRDDLMARFRGYGERMKLHSTGNVIAHLADNGRVIVLEYEVDGAVVATGVEYHNRFASIIKLHDRKITHWRDYMDSLAAWNALTAHRST